MLPLLLACVSSGDALPFGSTAADCASCHPDHVEAWASSGHGTSGTSPVFQALLPEVEAQWGSFARKSCETCHMPGHGGEASIGCVSCHAATGNHGESDGRLAINLDAPLSGPLGTDSIPTGAHGSTPRDLLATDSLCGTCHEVTGPNLFVERTLTEHRASPAAAEGRPCVDCHALATEDRPLTPDTPARSTTDHRYVALSPPWGADPDTQAAAAESTRALLASGLSLTVERAADGSREVVVRNEDAGHSIPTGVSFLRAIWVDFDDTSIVSEPLLSIGSVPMRDGVPVVLPTAADTIEDETLAPGESRRATLPDSAGTVHLRARAFRDDVLDALALGDLADTLPTIEIAAVTVEARTP